jgi:hypothetical protein
MIDISIIKKFDKCIDYIDHYVLTQNNHYQSCWKCLKPAKMKLAWYRIPLCITCYKKANEFKKHL